MCDKLELKGTLRDTCDTCRTKVQRKAQEAEQRKVKAKEEKRLEREVFNRRKYVRPLWKNKGPRDSVEVMRKDHKNGYRDVEHRPAKGNSDQEPKITRIIKMGPGTEKKHDLDNSHGSDKVHGSSRAYHTARAYESARAHGYGKAHGSGSSHVTQRSYAMEEPYMQAADYRLEREPD